MKDVLIIYCLFCLCSLVLGSSDDDNKDDSSVLGSSDDDNKDDSSVLGSSDDDNKDDSSVFGSSDGENKDLLPPSVFLNSSSEDENVMDTKSTDDEASDINNPEPPSNCWFTLNAEKHIKILDEIDSRYSKIRKEVHESLLDNEFDKSMIQGFIRERGIALREISYTQHQKWMIPSGMNLGGYCMLRMPESMLFFHRMKLRNNTYFRVDALHNELDKLVVRLHLSLNDLHLKGAYERSLTDSDPSVFIYAPTFGEVEFLLKDVKYKLEGRYRLIENRLLIELVTSEIIVDDVLMTYISQVIESAAIKISKGNLGAFLSRLKVDLDKWIKDYFNDYMIYAQMDGIPNIDELAKYDKEKGTALEEFTDYALRAIATRIRDLNADNVRLPSFTFKSIHGLKIKLHEGVIKGLDSIYRRSVATGYKEKVIRYVDSIVGFSSLKVVYKYEALMPTGVPPVSGTLTLSANDLAAHMALAMVPEPETVDLDLEFLDQTKPESLTVEGPANLMISNFKHLLEHQILAIMSNTLINGVITLRSLPRCEPFVPGQIENKGSSETETDLSIESDSEDVLRAKGSQRLSAKHPKSLMKQSNRSKTRKIKRDQKTDKKKNQTKLKKYKQKNKRKQEINKI